MMLSKLCLFDSMQCSLRCFRCLLLVVFFKLFFFAFLKVTLSAQAKPKLDESHNPIGISLSLLILILVSSLENKKRHGCGLIYLSLSNNPKDIRGLIGNSKSFVSCLVKQRICGVAGFVPQDFQDGPGSPTISNSTTP